MADAIYTVVLDLTDDGCIETGWRLKQGDSGLSKIVAKIVSNGVDVYDSTATPEIAFKRADGNSVLSTMVANDGYYEYTFVGNEISVVGRVVMDVTFTDSEDRISTCSARFEVVENPAGYDPEGTHTYDNPVSQLVALATEDALIAEGFAVGQQRGQDVQESSPYYHNNAKYYSDLTDPTALRNMSDVDFDNLQNGQVPVYNSTTQKWENGSGGGGGGGSTVTITPTISTGTKIADYVIDGYGGSLYAPNGGGGASSMADLTDVELTSLADDNILQYDSSTSKWVNVDSLSKSFVGLGNVDNTSDANKPVSIATQTAISNAHKVTNKAVDLTSWTTDTTSQSGTTLYKKQVTLNHVYVESPSVDIGSSGVLPTVAQQEAYNLLQYVTVDDTVPCLYLYASDIPTDSFYINVEGVD